MTKDENLDLKNQIKEVHTMFLEINTSFYIIANELKELSKTISKFRLPELDFTTLDLKGDLK